MPKEIAKSIHQKLLNKARADGQTFNELLQYFVIERFLYRLSQSSYADQFILKGALLFRVWMAQDTRATRDIDFLAYCENSTERLVDVIQEIVAIEGDSDGLIFDVASVEGKIIKEDAEYEGVRILCTVCLGNAKSRLQLDIAFGDTVHPEPAKHQYPTLLDHSAPELYLYPVETVFAEKLEAMIHLGEINSRMKDFFDIWRLMKNSFEGSVLFDAVKKTFANRGTEATHFEVLVHELTQSNEKQMQWTAFLAKSHIAGPEEFEDLLTQIAAIASPVLDAVLNESEFTLVWRPGGPWEKLDEN